jgi:integrase
MKLTNSQIEVLKPKDKPYKVFDSEGLYLLVNPTGSKIWKHKFRFDKKERLDTIGKFPHVGIRTRKDKVLNISIQGARERRDENRALLTEGINPVELRKTKAKAIEFDSSGLFKNVFKDWLNVKASKVGTQTYQDIQNRYRLYLEKPLGNKLITELGAKDFINLLQEIEATGKIDTTRKLKGICQELMQFAVINEYIKYNPVHGIEVVLKKKPKKHFPTIIDPFRLGQVLKLIYCYGSPNPIVNTALKMTIHLFKRSNELRNMKWVDINFIEETWTMDVSKSSESRSLVVPLSSQVIEMINSLRPYSSDSEYVFRGFRTRLKPISNTTILNHLQGIGISNKECVPHGFRATARTLIVERIGYSESLVEHELGHSVRDALGRAYNRTEFLDKRREMMQEWSNYLEGLKNDEC